MSKELSTAIQDVLATTPPQTTWRVGVANQHGLLVNIGADEAVDQGLSLKKLPIALALRRSGVSLDATIKLQRLHMRDGDGILQYFPLGYDLTVGRAAELMLSLSDNVATRVVVAATGGPHKVNDLLRQGRDPIGGLPIGYIRPVESGMHTKDDRYYFGPTTARSSIAYMQTVVEDPVFGPALRRSDFWYGSRLYADWAAATPQHPASQALSAAIQAKVHGQVLDDAVYNELLAAEYPQGRVATKNGVLDGYRHEVAVIGNLTVAMLSEGYDPLLPEGPAHPAHLIHASIGALVWEASRS
jgi:beta-lactamase class A